MGLHLVTKLPSLLVLVAVFQLSFLSNVNLHDKNGVLKVAKEQVAPTSAEEQAALPAANGLPGEYVLWSKSETFFEYCREHYLNNETWAEPLRPLVDKITAKQILEEMNIEGLKIPRTLAIYDQANYTSMSLEALQALPQPYIIKPSHTSGGVSRVKDDKFQCFKRCKESSEKTRSLERQGKRIISALQTQSAADLERDFSKKHGELQYAGLPHRILIEEDVMVGDITTDVTYFYCAGGKLLFASMQCGEPDEGKPGYTAERSFFTADYRQVAVRLNKPPCEEIPPKPKTWDRQVEIVTELAEKLDGRAVRIDLYAGGEDEIYFSEFTFTTANCQQSTAFSPRVADGLVYAAEHDLINTTAIDSQYVQQMMEYKPWNFIALQDGIHLMPETAGSYHSPVDMCEVVGTDNENVRMSRYTHETWEKQSRVQKCLGTSRQLATNTFRCMAHDLDTNAIYAIGADQNITLAAIIDRVDYGRAFILIVIVGYMTYYNIGTKEQPNQYLNNVLYLLAMMLFLLFSLPDIEGVYSGIPITTIVDEAFEAFKLVHPMESPFICISHFLTYWFKVASWRSKSLRNLLFYQLLVEVISAFFNEWAHLTEPQPQVRCMRLAFIGAIKHYALDNVIREYIMPPFYVYFWLLPNFIWYWACAGLSGVASLFAFW